MSAARATLAIAPGAPGASLREDAVTLYASLHPAMGTEYALYLYASSCEEAEAAAKPAFDEISRIDELLSNYREGSELSRINREATLAPVTTDPEVFRFLEAALQWSKRSGGAFDMTLGKLMKTWGFFGASGALPSKAKIAETRSQVGWRNVRLDPEQRTVRFLSPGIEFDPGGIGKGYAVDRAIRILRTNGVQAALLSSGGSTIYAMGAPAGMAAWKIQVPAPGREADTVSTVELRDMSLSTANRSQKYFVENGRLYGSIMDPLTLSPSERAVQATVIAPSALDSDALSNALFVLGPEESASLLEKFPQISALIVSAGKTALRHKAIRWPASVANINCMSRTNEEEGE